MAPPLNMRRRIIPVHLRAFDSPSRRKYNHEGKSSNNNSAKAKEDTKKSSTLRRKPKPQVVAK